MRIVSRNTIVIALAVEVAFLIKALTTALTVNTPIYTMEISKVDWVVYPTCAVTLLYLLHFIMADSKFVVVWSITAYFVGIGLGILWGIVVYLKVPLNSNALHYVCVGAFVGLVVLSPTIGYLVSLPTQLKMLSIYKTGDYLRFKKNDLIFCVVNSTGDYLCAENKYVSMHPPSFGAYPASLRLVHPADAYDMLNNMQVNYLVF